MVFLTSIFMASILSRYNICVTLKELNGTLPHIDKTFWLKL